MATRGMSSCCSWMTDDSSLVSHLTFGSLFVSTIWDHCLYRWFEIFSSALVADRAANIFYSFAVGVCLLWRFLILLIHIAFVLCCDLVVYDFFFNVCFKFARFYNIFSYRFFAKFKSILQEIIVLFNHVRDQGDDIFLEINVFNEFERPANKTNETRWSCHMRTSLSGAEIGTHVRRKCLSTFLNVLAWHLLMTSWIDPNEWTSVKPHDGLYII